MPKPRPRAYLFLVLAAALTAQAETPSFPLPLIDGKRLAVGEGQRAFEVPWSFRRLEQFYRQQFRDDPSVRLELGGEPGARRLTLRSRAPKATWTRATVIEGTLTSRIEVVPVLRLADEQIEGNGRPLVEFVFGRSPDAAKAAAEIDHLGR